MAEIEMPPESMRPDNSDPYDTSGNVQANLRQMAHNRVTDYVTLVEAAVTEFTLNVNPHIEALQAGRSAVDAAGLVESFLSVVLVAMPGGEGAKAGVEIGKELFKAIAGGIANGVQGSYNEGIQHDLEEGKDRLRNAVAALGLAASKHATLAYNHVDQVIDDAVEQAMTWVDASSNDNSYLEAMLDYLGFAQPTREDVLDPIRQSMENAFFGLYEWVTADLQGQYANNWQHEAAQAEQAMYAHDGEKAWSEAYDPNHPIPDDWDKHSPY